MPTDAPKRVSAVPDDGSRNRLRIALSILKLLISTILGLVGTAAAAYFVAPVAGNLSVLILIPAIFGVVVSTIGSWVSARKSQHRRRFILGAGAITATVIALVTGYLAWQRLPAVANLAPDPRGPHRVWHLDTGSRLAVWVLPGQGVRHRTPVIVLHGGPGEFTTPSMMRDGGPFRRRGFDTVYFDQAGTGASDFVPVAAYDIDRAVADLEAVRRKTGASRVILWGQSWGAILAGLYARRFPNRLAGILLTSPGPFPGLKAKEKEQGGQGSKAPEFPLKAVAWITLLTRNPALAQHWISQRQAQMFANAIVTQTDPYSGRCADLTVKSPDFVALGANPYPAVLIARDFARLPYRPPTRLAIPALIVRGTCDSVPRAAAQHYLKLFDPVRFVEIPDAGHLLKSNRPLIDGAVSTFVDEDLRQLP